MRLTSLYLRNFRCFGPERTVVHFDQMTALLGANGSGKTAILQALSRLFGTTQTARTLTADDFHVPHGERRDDAEQRELIIEAHFAFPTLNEPVAAGVEGTMPPIHAFDPTVPSFFEQMAVDTNGVMCCRIRLTGQWTRTSDPEGTVEAQLQWLRSMHDEPPPEERSVVSPIDRDRVRVHYVPASRDASRHLTASAGGLLQQLLRAVEWDDDRKAAVDAAGEQLRRVFVDHPAVTRLNDAAGTHWNGLYDEWLFRQPSLSIAARQIPELVRSAHMVFGPSHAGGEHALDRLSDGQQSLFYFACIGTLFEIQRETYLAQRTSSPHNLATEPATPDTPAPNADATSRRSGSESASAAIATTPSTGTAAQGFAYERLKPADLTIFAIEEPENHLAPHYLGRIVARLTEVLQHGGAQVVLASHAPAVLARIDPSNVRHLRRCHQTHRAQVSGLVLPAERTEAERYIREAVRAYPELYFARAVVLCEGDSEQTVLPRFARALGTDLDLAFVSVVPLGGRHVNHFWRLLNGLGVPFVTLLDLDRERGVGGWARVKDVCRQLLAFTDGAATVRLLAGPPGLADAIDDTTGLDALGRRDPVADGARLLAWVGHLRSFDVFFSAPLDLDFMMLEAFEAEYRATAEGGEPRLDVARAIARVLGESATGESYTNEQRALFAWYGYLFYGRGKPSTHTAAWVGMEAARAREGIPEPIVALFERLRAKLSRLAPMPAVDTMDRTEAPPDARASDDRPVVPAPSAADAVGSQGLERAPVLSLDDASPRVGGGAARPAVDAGGRETGEVPV